MMEKFEPTEYPSHHLNYEQKESQKLLHKIKNIALSSSLVPKPVDSVSEEEKEKQRVINKESALHQLDLELRKTIAEIMKSEPSKKKSGKQLSDIKREVINQARAEFNFKQEEIQEYVGRLIERA